MLLTTGNFSVRTKRKEEEDRRQSKIENTLFCQEMEDWSLPSVTVKFLNVIESQNKRMAWAGGDLNDHLVSTPPAKNRVTFH